ncbi:MAG: hypothetical protein Q7S17_06520 [Xanthobacteraceae bacterium]|nr:hypothetical protein [Xanthobacteraceae bacterium]
MALDRILHGGLPCRSYEQACADIAAKRPADPLDPLTVLADLERRPPAADVQAQIDALYDERKHYERFYDAYPDHIRARVRQIGYEIGALQWKEKP